jgi:hypothetical protein
VRQTITSSPNCSRDHFRDHKWPKWPPSHSQTWPEPFCPTETAFVSVPQRVCIPIIHNHLLQDQLIQKLQLLLYKPSKSLLQQSQVSHLRLDDMSHLWHVGKTVATIVWRNNCIQKRGQHDGSDKGKAKEQCTWYVIKVGDCCRYGTCRNKE